MLFGELGDNDDVLPTYAFVGCGMHPSDEPFPVTVFSAVMLSGLRCNAFWRHDSKFVLVAFGPVLAKSVANPGSRDNGGNGRFRIEAAMKTQSSMPTA